MSRPTIPARDDVPEASKPILDAVHKQLGVVPNMFRLIAQSPAALLRSSMRVTVRGPLRAPSVTRSVPSVALSPP